MHENSTRYSTQQTTLMKYYNESTTCDINRYIHKQIFMYQQKQINYEN